MHLIKAEENHNDVLQTKIDLRGTTANRGACTEQSICHVRHSALGYSSRSQYDYLMHKFL